MGEGIKTFSYSIPRLKGESNWQSWLVLINATLRSNRVKKYVDKDVPEPDGDAAAKETWAEERDTAFALLISSCDTLVDKLLNAGWKDDDNLFTLMQALEKYIPKVSGDAIGALVDEFAKGSAQDHKTLHDALKRVQYLRTRITNLTGDSSDHLWAILLLNYFKTRLPDTYKHYTNNNKKPVWTDVIETIYTLAQDEEQKMGLSLYKDRSQPQSSNSRAPRTNNNGNNASNDKNKASCVHCNMNHPSEKCWTAHPELIPLTHKNRASLLERANKHRCNKDSQGDGVGTAPATSVFVKGSSGILGGSALVSIAMRDRHVASPPIYAAVDSRVIHRNDIIVDSGCSGYLFRDMEHFTKYTPRDDLLPFTAANGDDVRPLGVGTVFFQTRDPLDPSKTIDWTIDDVEYSPLSPANLLSPGKLRKAGIDYDYKSGSLVHTNNARPIGKVEWITDVTVLQTCTTSDVPVDTAIALAGVRRNLKPTLEMMHRRLIHAHPSRVIEACRRVGIVFSKEEMDNFHCEACHLAKSTEVVSRDSPLPLTQIGEEIHLDLVEVRPLSMTGKRYALHFLDKYSGYHWLVLMLNHHYEVVRDAIKNFHDVFNNMTGLNVKTWVCDNAPEFKKVLRDPCFANTRVNFSIANTPSMNGSIERAGRTIIEAARTQLIDANLPQ